MREGNNNFEWIYTAYYRKSFLYVRSYVHDSLVAEDLVSDALIKLWERMKTECLNNVASYLLTILKNRILDHLKHEIVKKNAIRFVNESLKQEIELRISLVESSDPREIFSSEIEHIVSTTLNKLPDKTRDVFMMSRFEGKSHKEIASILGITVKGVDYHIAASLKELRNALKDYLPLLIQFFRF